MSDSPYFSVPSAFLPPASTLFSPELCRYLLGLLVVRAFWGHGRSDGIATAKELIPVWRQLADAPLHSGLADAFWSGHFC